MRTGSLPRPPPIPRASRSGTRPPLWAIAAGATLLLAIAVVVGWRMTAAARSTASRETPATAAGAPGFTARVPVFPPPSRREPPPEAVAPAPQPLPAPAGLAASGGLDGASPQAQLDSPGVPQAIIASTKPSVVVILVESPGEIASGTGFVVAPGLIATCAHVVDGAQRMFVVMPDGRQATLRSGPTDWLNDVTVLGCDAALPPPLPLGDAGAVREGDEIAVTGFPGYYRLLNLGFLPTASTSRGTLSARRTLVRGPDRLELFQIDAPVQSGTSGGPVYSTRDGTVVGLASARLTREHGIGFAVPVGPLRRLLGL